LFFTPDNIKHLFSRSVDIISGETIVEDQLEEPKPVIESLDGQQPKAMPINFDVLIQELEQELLETQNDPDKAIELRRRIQILQTQKAASIPPVDTPISQDL